SRRGCVGCLVVSLPDLRINAHEWGPVRRPLSWLLCDCPPSRHGKLTANADGSGTELGRGRTPAFFTPAEARRFGLPTVSILAGRLAISFDSAGNFTSVTLNGHVQVNVCAALS